MQTQAPGAGRATAANASQPWRRNRRTIRSAAEVRTPSSAASAGPRGSGRPSSRASSASSFAVSDGGGSGRGDMS